MTVVQVSVDVLIPLVSAIIGGVLAVGGNAVLNRNQRRIERANLRRLLSVEAMMLNSKLDKFPDIEGTYRDMSMNTERSFRGYERSLRHPQFDANQSELKLLSSAEFANYINFYDSVDQLRSKIDSESEIPEDSSLNSEHLGPPGYYHLDHARRYYERLSPYFADIDDLEDGPLDLEVENASEYA